MGCWLSFPPSQVCVHNYIYTYICFFNLLALFFHHLLEVVRCERGRVTPLELCECEKVFIAVAVRTKLANFIMRNH